MASAFGSRLLRPQPAASVPSWAKAIGVTRVARITELDVCGVEVACAIRPEGAILQVSAGKGRTFAHARATALSEALELWSCEHPDPARLRLLAPEGDPRFWTAATLDPEHDIKLDDSRAVTWVEAERLDARGRVLIPASHVWCPAEGESSVGARTRPWTANGVAAHPNRTQARWHGLFEVLEREAIGRAFPEGWTPRHLRERAIEFDHPIASRLIARGLTVHAVDATPRGWPIPVVAVLIADPDTQAPALAAGYACRPDAARAAEAALFEACQSRLTEIHGAREDAAPHAIELPGWIRRRPKRVRRLAELPRWGGPMASLLREMKVEAAAVELTPRGCPVHVTRVFVPGFRITELVV